VLLEICVKYFGAKCKFKTHKILFFLKTQKDFKYTYVFL
jgi:hypothetical protein